MRVPAVSLNPVFRREARALARSGLSPLVLFVYVGLLALLGGIFLYAQGPGLASYGTRAGLMYWSLLASTQLCLTGAMMPGLTAAGISGERERHTLDLVLGTGLSPWRLLWGKLAAALAVQAWLLLAALPVYSLLLWFGGLTVRVLLATFAVQVALAAVLGATALLCSALWRRTLAATLAAYACAVLLMFGPGLLARAIPAPPPGEVDPVHVWLRHASPFAAIADAARLPGGSMGAWLGNELRFEALARLDDRTMLVPAGNPVLGVLRPFVSADPGIRQPVRSAWPKSGLGALAGRSPAWTGFLVYTAVLALLSTAGATGVLRRLHTSGR